VPLKYAVALMNSSTSLHAPRAWSRLTRPASPTLIYILRVLAIAAVYTAAGKLGLDLAFATRSVTAIWPPTGIALAALILGGYRLWPAIALGALVANLDTGVPAVTVLGITCGNTLEALVGAYLLRRVAGFRPDLQRIRDLVYLVLFGAVLSTTVSASIGVASLLAGDAIVFDHVPSVWRTWWLGDMGGDLIVAPALLIAAAYRSFTRAPGRAIEAIALAGALAGTSVLVFSQSTPVTYVIFPLMAWAALRFLQPGAAAASLVVASIAVAFTANGDGPFASSGPDARLLLAQTFVAVAAVTSLVMAIVTNARHRAEETQRKIAQTLQGGLLPRAVPPIAGWEIATFYEPGGAGEVEVGGDFFDFFATDAGWIVVLGDVTGKGIEAATMTALMRHGARVASQIESGPAAILARLDQALREQPTLPPCSALCARLGTDHIIVSSAGHPRPLTICHDGHIQQVDGGGRLLGAWPGGDWPERKVRLGPDETIVFFTDGITDLRGETERFGDQRLRALLAEHAGLAPDELLAELGAALGRFQRGARSDDTAAVALRPAQAI
jgi:integral membrane sensor domain MASE1